MNLSDLAALIKLRQTLLLLLALYAGYAAGGGFAADSGFYRAIIIGLLGFASIAATTALNMVYDVDIDSVMGRTRTRPLPRGVYDPAMVKIVSLATILLCLAASVLMVNVWFALFMLTGFLFDIYVYTLYAKRRTPINIFLGAVAGAAPAIGGYAAAKGSVDLEGLLIGALIVAWIPAHVWLLALHYCEDYRKAGVPMLPILVEPRASRLAIAASILATLAITLLLYAFYARNPLLLLGAALFAASMALLPRCNPSRCITPFRLVNIGLGLVLLGLVLSG